MINRRARSRYKERTTRSSLYRKTIRDNIQQRHIQTRLRHHIDTIHKSNSPPFLFTNILSQASRVIPVGPWVQGIPGITQTSPPAIMQKNNFNPKHHSARENRKYFDSGRLAELQLLRGKKLC